MTIEKKLPTAHKTSTSVMIIETNLFWLFLSPFFRNSKNGVIIVRSVAFTIGASKYARMNPSIIGINITKKFLMVNDKLER